MSWEEIVLSTRECNPEGRVRMQQGCKTMATQTRGTSVNNGKWLGIGHRRAKWEPTIN